MTDQGVRIQLRRDMFTSQSWCLVDTPQWKVHVWRYDTGVEALQAHGPHGTITVLPFMGQMIWDLVIDGVTMTMNSPFTVPRPATTILDTYGCFAFHSGVLANGTPASEDEHPIHGEFPTSSMDTAWINIDQTGLTIGGEQEYIKGFGDHYRAEPSIRWMADQPSIEITMSVTNLASRPMPLQYMCHINHRWLPTAHIEQTFPVDLFELRTSVPTHVKPTPQWQRVMDELTTGARQLESLDEHTLFNPEIVRFANLSNHDEQVIELRLVQDDGPTFWTRFRPAELPVVTQWFLDDGDMRVAAFSLPGTCRPEGRTAAKATGTLLHLAPGEHKSFHVTTGLHR